MAAANETVIYIPHSRSEEFAEITTNNAKWLRQMEKLVEEGHAEENMDVEDENYREFSISKKLIRLPFYRKPRTYTAKQRKEAAERLAAVREARMAAKAEEEKKTVKKSKTSTAKSKAKPAPKATSRRRGKAKSKTVVEEVDDEDEDTLEDDMIEVEDDDEDELDVIEIEDDEVEDDDTLDDEEEEEVVVRSTRKRRGRHYGDKKK